MTWDFFEGQEPCQTTSECRNVGTRETILPGFYQDIQMCGPPAPLALLVPRTGSTSWVLHSPADPRCSLRIHPNTLRKATHPHAWTCQLKSNPIPESKQPQGKAQNYGSKLSIDKVPQKPHLDCVRVCVTSFSRPPPVPPPVPAARQPTSHSPSSENVIGAPLPGTLGSNHPEPLWGNAR